MHTHSATLCRAHHSWITVRTFLQVKRVFSFLIMDVLCVAQLSLSGCLQQDKSKTMTVCEQTELTKGSLTLTLSHALRALSWSQDRFLSGGFRVDSRHINHFQNLSDDNKVWINTEISLQTPRPLQSGCLACLE